MIIGSSNVAMTYLPEKFKEYPPYKMCKCTRIEVFKAVMDEIKDEKEVIIAVIENFLCDAVRDRQDPTPGVIDDTIDATIKDFMEVVRSTATKNKGTRFALAQPILRPRNDWYTERYEGFCRSFVSGINALGLVNVSKLEAMSRMSQNFAADQVHLTIESSKAYVNGLLYHADSLFTAEVIDLVEGTSKGPERSERLARKGDSRQQELDFEKNVRSLDKKLEDLNRDIFRRRFHDSLVMARLREDLDTVSNTNKEDKIMISGLTSSIPRPTGIVEARQWLKDIVSGVLESIEEGSSAGIIFVSQGRSNNRNIPLAEVRMKSKEQAVGIRKSFAQKKKAGRDYGKIYLSNCVTLATRVRIEILMAMAKKFESDTKKMFVLG
jgi:hypothetical protein